MGCQLLRSFSECLWWVYHSCGSLWTPKYNFAFTAMCFISLLFTVPLPSSLASRTQEIGIVYTETRVSDHSLFFSCITKLLICVHDPNKPITIKENLHIAYDESCYDMNCTTPHLFHYLAVSVTKHYSTRHSGMSLPLSSIQLCCRQGPPKIYFRTKGHLPVCSYLLGYPERYFKPLMEMRCGRTLPMLLTYKA
jgi:hypothetical protein